MNLVILNHDYRLAPRVALEVRSLRGEGHSVRVVGWARNKEAAAQESSDDCELVVVPSSRGGLGLLLKLPRAYRKMARHVKHWEVDVFHCTHLYLLPLTILLARRKGAAVVYDAYERHFVELAAYFGPFSRIARRIIGFVEDWLLVRRVHGVLTIDSPQGQLEKKYLRHSSNVQVLYNVPSLADDVNGTKSPAIPEEWWTQRALVYVGGLLRDKGLIRCLQVARLLAAQFSDMRLLLIGDFFQDPDPEILVLLQDPALRSTVRVLPWMEYGEMLQYCQRGAIGLALHQPEERFRWVGKGTGRKFFTYMQCSLPIVATDLAEVAQVVEEEECGLLVDATDIDATVGAITYLLEHPDMAEEMGMRGRRAILEKYNWETESSKLLRFYVRVQNHLDKRRACRRGNSQAR